MSVARGEWFTSNPHKILKKSKKHKKHSLKNKAKKYSMKKYAKKHSYKVKKKRNYKTKGGYSVKKRYTHKKKRNYKKHYSYKPHFANPYLLSKLNTHKRYGHKKRRNPMRVGSFGKKAAGIAVGALVPLVTTAVVPITFDAKWKNFLRDLIYVAIAYAVTRTVKATKGYANYVALGGVAGTFINYSRESILSSSFVKALQQTKALPPAEANPAKTNFYVDEGKSLMPYIGAELATYSPDYLS